MSAYAYVFGQPVIAWVQARGGCHDFGPCAGIGMLRHGKIAVGVLYNWFTTGNICMHIATDGLRRWIPRDYLWTSFRYPFWQLGCRRVTGLIDEHNLEARRLAVHLGFELETRLSQAMSDGDMLVYRMWKEDCRYLTWRAPHEHSENAVCA